MTPTPLSKEELRKQGKELLQSFVFYVEQNRRNYDNGGPDIYDAVLDQHLDKLETLAAAYSKQREVEAATGETSDGYHTFNELYAHRIALFIALAKSHADISWKAIKHADGTSWDGWFIAGMHLPTGDISYHLPESDWDKLDGVEALTKAPEWDGHTPSDVVKRLTEWTNSYE